MTQLELFHFPPVFQPPWRTKPKEWKVVSLRECPAPEEMICVNQPSGALAYWQQHIATAPHFNPDCECVAVLLLTTRLRVKGHQIVSIGMLNEAMAHPREVFRVAVMGAAYGIVLMHNHPSGEVTPSEADRLITKRICEAGRILRIEIHDHVIIGHQRYFSFRESGLL